jgi:hypothetical protein
MALQREPMALLRERLGLKLGAEGKGAVRRRSQVVGRGRKEKIFSEVGENFGKESLGKSPAIAPIAAVPIWRPCILGTKIEKAFRIQAVRIHKISCASRITLDASRLPTYV